MTSTERKRERLIDWLTSIELNFVLKSKLWNELIKL